MRTDKRTDKQTAEHILACLSAAVDARIKPMFGEYGVYADEKLIGQINENRLFVKATKFGEEYAPELEKASPYSGAKPAFLVPEQRVKVCAYHGTFWRSHSLSSKSVA